MNLMCYIFDLAGKFHRKFSKGDILHAQFWYLNKTKNKRIHFLQLIAFAHRKL